MIEYITLYIDWGILTLYLNCGIIVIKIPLNMCAKESSEMRNQINLNIFTVSQIHTSAGAEFFSDSAYKVEILFLNIQLSSN